MAALGLAPLFDLRIASLAGWLSNSRTDPSLSAARTLRMTPGGENAGKPHYGSRKQRTTPKRHNGSRKKEPPPNGITAPEKRLLPQHVIPSNRAAVREESVLRLIPRPTSAAASPQNGLTRRRQKPLRLHKPRHCHEMKRRSAAFPPPLLTPHSSLLTKPNSSLFPPFHPVFPNSWARI